MGRIMLLWYHSDLVCWHWPRNLFCYQQKIDTSAIQRPWKLQWSDHESELFNSNLYSSLLIQSSVSSPTQILWVRPRRLLDLKLWIATDGVSTDPTHQKKFPGNGPQVNSDQWPQEGVLVFTQCPSRGFLQLETFEPHQTSCKTAASCYKTDALTIKEQRWAGKGRQATSTAFYFGLFKSGPHRWFYPSWGWVFPHQLVLPTNACTDLPRVLFLDWTSQCGTPD